MTHPALNMMPMDAAIHDFLLARGLAVSKHAGFEHALFTLYAHFLQVSPDYAGVTFYRMNNARSRNAILERLLKKRHGATYNIFWNCLNKITQSLDDERNKIVHWSLHTRIASDDNAQIMSISLEPPNFWDRTENTQEISLIGVYDFIVKSDVITKLIYQFHSLLCGAPEMPQALRDIFLQPISYPLAGDHPLFQT